MLIQAGTFVERCGDERPDGDDDGEDAEEDGVARGGRAAEVQNRR
jgi:hypothetical protein